VDNLESPEGPLLNGQVKTPSKILTIGLPIVFFLTVISVIALQVESVNREILKIAESFGLYETPAVKTTYYQWINDKGQLVVSPNKPADKEFVVIEADSKLLENKNQIDELLIARSEAYRKKSLAPKTDSHSSVPLDDEDSILSNQISSFERAKYCIEMAEKVMAAAHELKDDKETKELRARHKRDCVDNFPVQ